MAELKERELKILSALSQLTELTRPTEIGQLVGENPLNTGRILTELGKGELAVQTDKERNLWAVTDTGKAPEPPPGGEIVPSQADLFKAEDEEELNRINEQEAMSLLS